METSARAAGSTPRVARWVADMILRGVQEIRYNPSPGEALYHPAATLEGVGGHDADDLSAALAAAYVAAGFECRFVIHGYNNQDLYHVLVQVKIGDDWFYADPSLQGGLNATPKIAPTSEAIGKEIK
jgi:transglutaminase-like putative cysteine protease